MTGLAPAHAAYAALSWAAFAVLATLAICWAIRPRQGPAEVLRWFSGFALRTMIIAGLIVGLIALILHADYIWRLHP